MKSQSEVSGGPTETKTEDDWRKRLTPVQYHVLREKGTEPPFTGKYVNAHDDAMYVCAGCGTPLFDSQTKFESGSGWPSFFKPVTPEAVESSEDRTHGMHRVEIHCRKCGGHLGHVFEDGPRPTGLRYCVNSESLQQKKRS